MSGLCHGKMKTNGNRRNNKNPSGDHHQRGLVMVGSMPVLYPLLIFCLQYLPAQRTAFNPSTSSVKRTALITNPVTKGGVFRFSYNIRLCIQSWEFLVVYSQF